MVVSTGLIVVSIPRWRQRLLQRPERVFSRRQAWVLVISGWLTLLVSFVLLWLLLPANEVRKLTIISVMILVVFFSAALLRVIRTERIIFQIRTYKFYFVTMVLVFVTLVVIFHGKVPIFIAFDEIWPIGTSWKQINDPEQFISLVPDRNFKTWFNFPANWPILGIYLKFFGVGIFQARFFYLIVAWISLPFIYIVTRNKYGITAAFAAVGLGLLAPIHFNLARSDYWVSTAITIAYFCYLSARASKGPKAQIYRYCCGLVSFAAIEGHVYGGAFALTFLILHCFEWIKVYKRNTRLFLKDIWPYFAGVLCFSLFWVGYNIVLPDINFNEAIRAIGQTYQWERSAIGEASQGRLGLLNPGQWRKIAQDYIFTQPVETVLLIIILFAALLRREKEDIEVIGIWLSGFTLISILSAHFFTSHFAYLYPLMCILFGAWISQISGNVRNQIDCLSFNFCSMYILVATFFLYIVLTFLSANSVDSIGRRNLFNRYVEIGKLIDARLPPEDVIVVGDHKYFLAMPHRLNYWSSFSFTWDLPEYWPLDPPQAIIVTVGVDEGWSGLRKWIIINGFTPISCHSIESYRQEENAIAILFTIPELVSLTQDKSCNPEMLEWLKI